MFRIGLLQNAAAMCASLVTLVPERVSVCVRAREREKCAADSISREDIFRLSSQTRRVPMAVRPVI